MPIRDLRGGSALAAVVCLLACGSSSEPSGPSYPVPDVHRPEIVTCISERAPANCTNCGGECTTDAECTEGLNGRCVSPRGANPYINAFCDFDACLVDGDCEDGPRLCLCGGTTAVRLAHDCASAANCRTDADCGEGTTGYCSPSQNTVCGGFYGNTYLVGAFCHTPQDRCTNHTECGDRGGPCIFDEGRGFWRCGCTPLE